MRLIVAIALLTSTAVIGFSIPESHNRVRRQLHRGTTPAPLPPLDGYTRQGVPVVRSSYADSKHIDTSFDGRNQELDHYRDFVNDPWVNTEDLGRIIQTRPRPELRSGRGSVDDEIWTRRRQQPNQQQQQHYQHYQQQQQQRTHSPLPTSASWSRVPDPSYLRTGGAENPNRVRGRTQGQGQGQGRGHQGQGHYSSSQTQPRSLNTNTNTNNQYLEGGDAWWEVASRGEDHITYRRRQSHRPYDVVVQQPPYQQSAYSANANVRRHEEAAPIRQLGQGEGQVLARVVDLRSGTEQIVREDRRRNSYGGAAASAGAGNRVSYQPARTYQTSQSQSHTQPELRSLNQGQSQSQSQGEVREGNWVKSTSSDSNYVTWRKVGSSASGSGSGQGQGHYESTYSSGGSASGRGYHQGPQSYAHASRTRESWTVRPVPIYPIMNDRETAEKARLSGPNVMVQK